MMQGTHRAQMEQRPVVASEFLPADVRVVVDIADMAADTFAAAAAAGVASVPAVAFE